MVGFLEKDSEKAATFTTVQNCNLIGPPRSPDPLLTGQPCRSAFLLSLSLTPTSASSSRSTVNVVKMQTAMTMGTLGLGLGAHPRCAPRRRGQVRQGDRRYPGRGQARAMAARRAAVTVRAGGNPEPIVQAPFKGIKDDLAARGPLYIDDFKQGISPKSLVSHRARSFER